MKHSQQFGMVQFLSKKQFVPLKLSRLKNYARYSISKEAPKNSLNKPSKIKARENINNESHRSWITS